MPSSRPSGPPGRGASRPGARPGRRPGPSRQRPTPAARTHTRPRITGRAAILVLVLAVLMVSYASSLRAYLEQQKHLDSLHRQILHSQAEIARMEREKRRWKDPAFLKEQARERFGWVMPGQVGYQVIGPDAKPLDPGDSLSDPGTVTESSHPLWWQSAWGSVVAAGNPKQQRPAPAPLTRISPPRKHRR